MKDLQNKIWSKAIQENLEAQMEILNSVRSLRLIEETEKMNQQIIKAREEIKNLSVEELAEILVAFENKTDEQERIIKNLKESLQSLEKIRDIIISEYGLEEY